MVVNFVAGSNSEIANFSASVRTFTYWIVAFQNIWRHILPKGMRPQRYPKGTKLFEFLNNFLKTLRTDNSFESQGIF